MFLDFTRLSPERFEFFCEDLLDNLEGITVILGPSRGPDGKKDIVIQYQTKHPIGLIEHPKFAVECKNNAISNKSVYPNDIGDIRSILEDNSLDGYLLITTTLPSSGTQTLIKTANANRCYKAYVWDKKKIPEMVNRIKNVKIRQKLLNKYGLYPSTIYYSGELVNHEHKFIVKINKKLKVPFKTLDSNFNRYQNFIHIINGHVNLMLVKREFIGDLIEKIGIFQEMISLTLNEMRIKSIPKSLKKLEKLEYLNLKNNKVSEIPNYINDFEYLKELNISGNPLKKVQIGVELINRLKITIDKTQIPVFRDLFVAAKLSGNSLDLTVDGCSSKETEEFILSL